jgi:hypothetical protein
MKVYEPTKSPFLSKIEKPQSPFSSCSGSLYVYVSVSDGVVTKYDEHGDPID